MRIVKPSFSWMNNTVPDYDALLGIISDAGRVCYQSEPSGKNNADFVRGLIKRGHESVLEHASIGVKIICDRGVTHEHVRHRIAAYSQESTRYVNYSKDKFGGDITYIDLTEGIRLCPVTSKLPSSIIAEILAEWLDACADAEQHYMRMIELGASPQIARSVLNNSTKSQLAVTFNIREWRHFFRLRCDKAAHPQMREVARMLLRDFEERYPALFEDLED